MPLCIRSFADIKACFGFKVMMAVVSGRYFTCPYTFSSSMSSTAWFAWQGRMPISNRGAFGLADWSSSSRHISMR